MDLIETCFIWAILWYYFIAHFGDRPAIDSTPWTVGFITLLSSIITGVVQEFYAYRIFVLNKHHWLLPFLIVSAQVSPVNLFSPPLPTFLNAPSYHTHPAVVAGFIIFPTFTSFRQHTGWFMTTGLSLLAGTDLIVTFSLIHLLSSSRTSTSSSINGTLTSLIQYTFKIGIINWYCRSRSFTYLRESIALKHEQEDSNVYLSASVYGNSFFSVLNAREALRKQQSQELSDPVFRVPSSVNLSPSPSPSPSPRNLKFKLQVPPRTLSISKSMSSALQFKFPRDSESSQSSSSNHASGTSVGFNGPT
ncbi:hypothetical protein C0995_012686 [Termitomyces sp. Mi166|nr:hypothetical protein C0995_012686 [Termitomyces sp. Mi166\